MKNAALAVLLEHETKFLSQEEISELVDIYGDPPEDMKTLKGYSESDEDLNAKNETDTDYDYGRQLALSNPNGYGSEQSSGGSIIWGGLKWLFMNAAGLGVPYAGYKVVKALASGKGAAAVVAGVAATTGLDVDTH